jgi:Trehalase
MIENKKIENELLEEATLILEDNRVGNYTVPSRLLYPHQWFWDSCFIAIGLRHIDPQRAKSELTSLLRGQWKNGMIPNIVFSDSTKKLQLQRMWRSQISPFSPDNNLTSGITQPPMLAEAVFKIGESLDKSEKKLWYKSMYKPLLKFHEWIYADRDPHNEGLVLLLHPWESGMDNSPPWISELHSSFMPKWIELAEKIKLDKLYGFARLDTKFVPIKERMSNSDALALYSMQKNMRKLHYDTKKILGHNNFAIEDLTFNSILIKANSYLKQIALVINEKLPKNLSESMDQTISSLDKLWDESSSQYYSRKFETHELIKVPSIASLMPLYSGAINQERADHLVKVLEDHTNFSCPYPVPTVPVNSEWFNPLSYWQGPTWVNMNWLIIEGLTSYGFPEQSEVIKKKTIELITKSGFCEYFNPITGEGLGIHDFSWSAALLIDILKN